MPLMAFEVPKANLPFGTQQSDYMFVLAHWMEHWEYRSEVYSAQNQGKMIFLDNSAFELGSSVNIGHYLTLIREIKPEVVIVPDVVGDLAKTVKLSRQFYEGLPGDFYDKYKFMIVLQGQDNRERMKCLHILKSFNYPFDYVGLPRHACPNRIELLQAIKRFVSRKKIHFLGLPDPAELRGIGDQIYSLDTSWVSKYSIGKGGYDPLNFEEDEINEAKFAEGLAILKSYL